jgi:hypothetical protein
MGSGRLLLAAENNSVVRFWYKKTGGLSRQRIK